MIKILFLFEKNMKKAIKIRKDNKKISETIIRKSLYSNDLH